MCYLPPSQIISKQGVLSKGSRREGGNMPWEAAFELLCLLASIKHLNFWGFREGAVPALGAGGTKLALLERFICILSNSMHTCISAGAHVHVKSDNPTWLRCL